MEVVATFSDEDGADADVRVYNFGPGSPVATGFITGLVVDGNGEPVQGATVTALGANISAVTDGNGVYELEVPRGLYDIEVREAQVVALTATDVRVMADLGVSGNFLPACDWRVTAAHHPLRLHPPT